MYSNGIYAAKYKAVFFLGHQNQILHTDLNLDDLVAIPGAAA
jgi:hypothetical protein